MLYLFRRKKEGRAAHELSHKAKNLRGIKAKLYHKKRYAEKVSMRKLYVVYYVDCQLKCARL
jgi:hypothetical protein